MKKHINVCIIILNWNGIAHTRTCLRSLLQVKRVSYKIFVIDNGSRRNEATQLMKEFDSSIEVHRLPENIGFTGGCNYGIMQAKKYHPDFYLLLNNDTKVTKNFLSILIATAKKDKEIGLISPIIYDKNAENINFAGGYINWSFGKTYHNKKLITKAQPYTFITGCCLLIKKEVIGKIGLLDAQFFAYFEDAAYCVLARRAGFLCVCEPRAIITHQQTASSDKKGSFNTYLMARNRILFVNSYAPQIIKCYFLLFNFIKLLGALCFFLFTNQKHRVYAYYRGYIDGTKGKGGVPKI